MTKAGQLITDGNAVWIIDDVRDGARVGDIILRPTLRDGFVKANGATVKASEYPRLLAWAQEAGMTVTAEQYAQDSSKYVYDEAQDKLTLPNAVGRALMGGESVKSIEAGLPNITGGINNTFRTISGGGGYGAMVGSVDAGGQGFGSGGAVPSTIVRFDASKSNPIYGAADTVQPRAITLIAQIKY
nr:MAG TPA: LONG TAIL FIBER PROTEIN [Caudoviricetes sp.]